MTSNLYCGFEQGLQETHSDDAMRMPRFLRLTLGYDFSRELYYTLFDLYELGRVTHIVCITAGPPSSAHNACLRWQRGVNCSQHAVAPPCPLRITPGTFVFCPFLLIVCQALYGQEVLGAESTSLATWPGIAFTRRKGRFTEVRSQSVISFGRIL